MQKLKSAVLLILASAPLLLFQNCTASTTGFNTGSTAQVNSVLATKPMPVEITLNQISYMSCPANPPASTASDPLADPFYRFRIGAYDNSASNGFTSIIGASHVGGIGFTKDAMNYMRSISASPTPTMLANYLKTSPYTANATPVATLIYRSRSMNALSPNAMATPILTALSDATLQNGLINQTQITNSGTQKMSYFPALDTVTGSLVSSINQTSGTELSLRQSLASQFLFMGFTPSTSVSDPAQAIANLIGPDNNQTKRLFGNGYSLTFGANNYIAQNGISEWNLSPANGFNPVLNQQGAWDCFPLTVVRDIDRKYYTVNTATPATTLIAGYGWNSFANPPAPAAQLPMTGYCPIAPFTMSNLPNGYQVYPYNPAPGANTCLAIPNALIPGQNAYLPAGSVVDPRAAGSAVGQYGLLTPNQSGINGIRMSYFDSTTINHSVTNQLVNADIDDAMSQLANYYSQSDRGSLLLGGATGGNFYACPPEDPTTMSQAQLDRLRIVRRFLLPELWDVNISQACAVPTATTNSVGSCYNSGDTNSAKIIQYDGIDGVSCGVSATGQTLNECPARISFCWRYR